MNEKDIIPANLEGAQSNTESIKGYNNEKDAEAAYREACRRLMHPHLWHECAGKATSDFELTDASGNIVSRAVQEGDHFRIDIPGPGSETGEGYDWVRVEQVEISEEPSSRFTAIRVRPSTNPLNKNQDVAHFFKDAATSSFVVSLHGLRVKAAVYGRNEMPNTDAEKLVDKTRNTAVAAGAITGFAKLQWKSLVDGLLSDEH